MSRETLLIFLALLVGVSPFSGLPIQWLTWVLPFIAAVILIIGISLRRERGDRERARAATVIE